MDEGIAMLIYQTVEGAGGKVAEGAEGAMR